MQNCLGLLMPKASDGAIVILCGSLAVQNCLGATVAGTDRDGATVAATYSNII